eukprot:scaffold1882_cov384-Prasinococcus_capsulatus_cf.AAC.15
MYGMGPRSLTARPVNTVGGGSLSFKLCMAPSSPDCPVIVEYKKAGGAWTRLAEYTHADHGGLNSSAWAEHVLDIPQNAESAATKFRFRQPRPAAPGLGTDEESSAGPSIAGAWALDKIHIAVGSSAPRIVLQTTPQGLQTVKDSPIYFLAHFSKVVRGFESRDVVVSNGRITALNRIPGLPGTGYDVRQADSKVFLHSAPPIVVTYRLTLQPSNEGPVEAHIPPGVCTDSNGVGNTPSNKLIVLYDLSPPHVVVAEARQNSEPQASEDELSLGGGGRPGLRLLTILFSEPVREFAEHGLAVKNGLVQSVAGGQHVYQAEIQPATESSIVVVTVLSNSTMDLAGNPNLASQDPYFLYASERRLDEDAGIGDSDEYSIGSCPDTMATGDAFVATLRSIIQTGRRGGRASSPNSHLLTQYKEYTLTLGLSNRT